MFLFYFFFLWYTSNSISPDFVKDYHILRSKNDELNYISKYKKYKKASIVGYVVSLKMKQAKYKFLPWDKMMVFNKQKNNLEKLIKENPNNIHLIYIRLIIQENTPRLLGYFSNIESDKKILNQFLIKKDSTDYLDKYIFKNTSL